MIRYCPHLKFAWLPICLVSVLSTPVLGQHWFGVLRGVTRDSSTGQPLPETEVSASNVTDGSERHLLSGKDGSFVIRVAPGTYKVVATKDGFRQATATQHVAEVTVDRFDLSLQAEPPAVAAEPAQSLSTANDNIPSEAGFAKSPQMVAVKMPAETPDAVAKGNVNASIPNTSVPKAQVSSNAAVLEELEALRKRIEQLETQLHSQTQSAGNVPHPAAVAQDSQQPVLTASLKNPPVVPPVVVSKSPLPTLEPRAGVPVKPQEPTSQPTQEKTSTPVVQAQPDMQTPFADVDWTWLNGNSRTKDSPLDSKYFTGEFRADTNYGIDFNQPIDHSMGGSSEVFRSSEVQLEQISLGGDLHVGNVRGRLLTLFGEFATTTPRNDASVAVGQWDARTAYRYLAEAYGGYHFNVNHGLNIDAGIFVSYVGLFSYYNFDNWAYQPSYVSSNTPWFFNGVRVQWFPTHHLKIEPWFINGWQAYNKFNGHPGLGGQLRWAPKDWLNIISNNYGVGNDNIGLKHRGRYHTDNSVEVKYFDRPKSDGIDKMAFTVTGDMGCETGDGVTCHGGKGGPKQSFLGWMAYDRTWFKHDKYAFTLGGGAINNPGRYLTLVLPVNGADAVSGTPYFPATPGSKFKAYDATATFDYMPVQYFTFRTEFGYRHANVPYFTGRHGITPPGGNNGSPADYVCSNGSSSGATDLSTAQVVCGGASNVWYPDLRQGQALLIFSIMVKF